MRHRACAGNDLVEPNRNSTQMSLTCSRDFSDRFWGERYQLRHLGGVEVSETAINAHGQGASIPVRGRLKRHFLGHRLAVLVPQKAVGSHGQNATIHMPQPSGNRWSIYSSLNAPGGKQMPQAVMGDSGDPHFGASRIQRLLAFGDLADGIGFFHVRVFRSQFVQECLRRGDDWHPANPHPIGSSLLFGGVDYQFIPFIIDVSPRDLPRL